MCVYKRLCPVLLAVGLAVLVVPAAQAAPLGTLKQFRIPTANSQPRFLAEGSDGNLWFTEGAVPTIGRITPAGAITEFGPVCASCLPNDIVQGPTGILYFTSNDPAIGRITTAGVVLTAVPMPNTNA